jgi:ribonuclease P protein component
VSEQVAGPGHQPQSCFSGEARFPRRVRLHHKADFERVKSLGQTWRHPLFVLAVCQNDQGLSRIGLVAGKKIGNAVMRNRARRLLREAARLLYNKMTPGWDIVLIARPAISEVKAQHVCTALAEAAYRAGLIVEESRAS